MKLANYKIGTRLAFCFGTLIFLMLILGGVGIKNILSVTAVTNEIVNERYVKLSIVSHMSDEINVAARNVRNAMLARNEAEQAKYLDKALTGFTAAAESANKLEKLMSDSRGKEMMEQLKDSRSGYSKKLDFLNKLIKDKKVEEATTYLFSDLIPEQDKYLSVVSNMRELQEMMMNESKDKSQIESNTAVTTVTIASIASVIVALSFAFFSTRSITRPLATAVTVADAVASGDLTIHMEATSRDETGLLLEALKKMRDNLIKIVGEVRTGTDTINTASSEIARGNLDLSSRTEEQASSLEETASALEELTSTVRQNAENANNANQLAETASTVARAGGTVVNQVVDTMESINNSSKKIVDIISVIDGIAFQTNILALNAAVEAARAGEQGRGFAVVASEVRNLAQRSASAAKEIKSLIDDSVEKVSTGSKLVEQAGATMTEVVNSVQRVTEVVAEISAAGNEQSQGIEQINQAITQMDQTTQQNAALVEEAAAAAQSMQTQADRLSHSISVFKTNIGNNRDHIYDNMKNTTSHNSRHEHARSVDITPGRAALT